MLKGVNKQVLEITETRNGYFEKAIFFVKPEYSGLSEGKLRESAKKEIEKTGRPPKNKADSKGAFIKTALCIFTAFGIGITIGTVFF